MAIIHCTTCAFATACNGQDCLMLGPLQPRMGPLRAVQLPTVSGTATGTAPQKVAVATHVAGAMETYTIKHGLLVFAQDTLFWTSAAIIIRGNFLSSVFYNRAMPLVACPSSWGSERMLSHPDRLKPVEWHAPCQRVMCHRPSPISRKTSVTLPRPSRALKY